MQIFLALVLFVAACAVQPRSDLDEPVLVEVCGPPPARPAHAIIFRNDYARITVEDWQRLEDFHADMGAWVQCAVEEK